MIRETAPTREGIAHIVNHMRERDRQEIMALRWDSDLTQFANDVCCYAGATWRMWERNGVPVAIAGVTPVRPGVVQAGAFGTPDWKYAARHIIGWGRNWMIPRLIAANFHRAEAYALASNTDSRRFIEALGGEIETPLHHYGREREDFILYLWRLDDVHRWRRRGQQCSAERGALDQRKTCRGRSGLAARSH